jgi:hypothetical protein
MKSRRYSQASLLATLRMCAGAVLVCALIVGFMSTRRAAAERRNEISAQRIREARGRLDRANESWTLVAAYANRYQELIREGLTARFDRAVAGDWFESALRARDLGVVDGYFIGKDVPYTGPESTGLTAFRIVSHRLEFTGTAADEDEVVDLMDSLENHVPGTTAQEACSLTRHRESNGGNELLELRCAMIWYEFAPNDNALTANLPST